MLSEIPYHADFIVCWSYWLCKGLKLEISIYTIKHVAEVLASYPSNHLINKSENVDFEHNIVRHSQLKYANISYSQTVFPSKCRPTNKYDT